MNNLQDLTLALENHEFLLIGDGNDSENGNSDFEQGTSREILANSLHALLLKLVIPNFDWVAWEDGKRMLKNKSLDYSGENAMTLCNLLTVIIRQDRFDGGFFTSCVSDGRLLKIIKALRANVALQ